MSCSKCAAEGICSCVNNYKELDLEERVIWTLGGTAPGGVDAVLSDERVSAIAPTLLNLQATLTVADASAGVRASAYYQTSSDGSTWDTAVFFQSGGGAMTLTANSTQVSDWVNGVANFKRQIRFGVHLEQASGTNVIAIARVKLVVGAYLK